MNMQEFLEKSRSVSEYYDLLEKLYAEGKTTGENQSPALLEYANLNLHRINRLHKTTKLEPSLVETAKNVTRKMIWLTLTEGWCGDAAQNLPIIEKIADESPNIEIRYLLRDENLELMDKYLTEGGRSIPKLICLDGETLGEIGTWGARPQVLQDYFHELKQQGLEKPEIIEKVQRWYNEDKGKSLEAEFEKLLLKWSA
jgi:Thioredoxin